MSITDYQPRTPAPIPQPLKGQIYEDPIFKTKILRATDEKDGTTCNISYPYWSPFSCDSKYLIIASDWTPQLYAFDPANFKAQKIGPLFGQDKMQWEGLSWSAVQPDVIFGISGGGVTRLRAYNVTTKAYIFNHDFAELPAGAPAQMSKARSNDRFFSFHHKDISGIVRAVVYDKQLDKTYILDVAKYLTAFNECRLSRDGRFLFLMTGRESAVREFATTAPVKIIGYDMTQRSAGHYDCAQSFVLQADTWGDNGMRLIKRSYTDPTKWSEVFDSKAKDWNNSLHISLCGPSDDYALISTEAGTPDWSLSFTNEIFLCKTDGSGQVVRLAHPRTSNSEYFRTSLASLSPDGRWFAYNSDFGGSHCDVYIGRVPDGVYSASTAPPAPIPTPTPPPVKPPPTPAPTPTPQPAPAKVIKPAVILRRFLEGTSVDSLAAEYGVDRLKIEQAIRERYSR